MQKWDKVSFNFEVFLLFLRFYGFYQFMYKKGELEWVVGRILVDFFSGRKRCWVKCTNCSIWKRGWEGFCKFGLGSCSSSSSRSWRCRRIGCKLCSCSAWRSFRLVFEWLRKRLWAGRWRGWLRWSSFFELLFFWLLIVGWWFSAPLMLFL